MLIINRWPRIITCLNNLLYKITIMNELWKITKLNLLIALRKKIILN